MYTYLYIFPTFTSPHTCLNNLNVNMYTMWRWKTFCSSHIVFVVSAKAIKHTHIKPHNKEHLNTFSLSNSNSVLTLWYVCGVVRSYALVPCTATYGLGRSWVASCQKHENPNMKCRSKFICNVVLPTPELHAHNLITPYNKSLLQPKS